MKRFIKEYANYQIEDIASNDLMQSIYKQRKIDEITRALKAYERGFITINETMRIISNV